MFNKVYIIKQNLLKNLRLAKQKCKSKVCAMVKADAYGLGLKEVVEVLATEVDFFGVASVEEADEVQKLCKTPILIVGALQRGQIKKHSYTCTNLGDLKYLASLNKKIKIHLKVNTGMNRFGFGCNQIENAIKTIKNSKLVLEGVFTHFATDDLYVAVQYKRFLKVKRQILSMGLNPIFHADNSVNCGKHKLDMVRVGFCLYCPPNEEDLPIKITAKVLQINQVSRGALVGYNYNFVASKKTRVAVVSLGYADGFLRGLIGLKLFAGGAWCKVLNVCMDCFMLDVSSAQIKKGGRLQILGGQNTVKNYARYLNTSQYEVLTNFGKIRAKKYIV